MFWVAVDQKFDVRVPLFKQMGGRNQNIEIMPSQVRRPDPNDLKRTGRNAERENGVRWKKPKPFEIKRLNRSFAY